GWQRFRCMPAGGEARRPGEAVDVISSGQWRNRVFANESEWPATWINFERLKYLSLSGQGERKLFKFAGLGHYGDAVLEREKKVAAAGFGLMPREEGDGFVSYPWMDNRPLAAIDVSAKVLATLADYCAFRQRAFAVELSNCNGWP